MLRDNESAGTNQPHSKLTPADYSVQLRICAAARGCKSNKGVMVYMYSCKIVLFHTGWLYGGGTVLYAHIHACLNVRACECLSVLRG